MNAKQQSTTEMWWCQDEFTRHLGQRLTLRLAAQPAEAVSHDDAKARAAAMITRLSGNWDLHPFEINWVQILRVDVVWA